MCCFRLNFVKKTYEKLPILTPRLTIGLFILGAAVLIYLAIKVDRSRIEHLKNGGVLACGSEGKTEVIDEGYRISATGLAILSKSGKKWSMKKCTPFPALPVK